MKKSNLYRPKKKAEKIVEIIHKYDKTPQKLVRAFHKKTTMIDPMDYHKIASEICQEQEKEIRQLLIDFSKSWHTLPGEKLISIIDIDQFIQEHENK